MNTTSLNYSRSKLAADFRSLMADVEELVKASAGQTGEHLASARERVSESLKRARADLDRAEQVAIEKARYVSGEVDGYAHQHPWEAVGIAAGIGFLIGALVVRR